MCPFLQLAFQGHQQVCIPHQNIIKDNIKYIIILTRINLSGDDEEPTSQEGDVSAIKGLNNGDNPNSISGAIPEGAPGVSEYGDEDVLLHVKGARVEREAAGAEAGDAEGGRGQRGRQEMADGEGGHLDGDLSDHEWLGAVREELVEEREHHARQKPEEPHPESPHR